MNQILQTEQVSNNNKKFNYSNYGGTSRKMGVDTIIKVFAIMLIVFGLLLSGDGALALSDSAKQKAAQKIPTVEVARKGNDLTVTVKSEIPLRSVGFAWNGEDFRYYSALQKTEFKNVIRVLDGDDNKLSIVVVDYMNKKTNYKEKYSSVPDTLEPEIKIGNEDPNIKVVVTDDTALDHVTYKYGDEPERTIEAPKDNPKRIEFIIDNIQASEQMLIIEAVDSSQNHKEERQVVKGTIKPKIEFVIDENDSTIVSVVVTDNENLQKVVIYIDGKRYSTPEDVSLNLKEFIQKVRIKAGTVLKVEAYNVNEQMIQEEKTF